MTSISNAGAFFFDNSLRIEQMFWLPATVCDEESMPQEFEDFINDDWPDRGDDPLFLTCPSLDRLRKEGDGDVPDLWRVSESLRHLPGVIFQLAHPVMSYFGDGDMASFSWGHYRTQWLYADSLEEIVGRCQEQLARWQEIDRAKSASAA